MHDQMRKLSEKYLENESQNERTKQECKRLETLLKEKDHDRSQAEEILRQSVDFRFMFMFKFLLLFFYLFFCYAFVCLFFWFAAFIWNSSTHWLGRKRSRKDKATAISTCTERADGANA
jgi:fatty-acid desaturase